MSFEHIIAQTNHFIEVDQRIMNRGVAESDLFTEVNLVSSVSLNVEKKYSLFVMLVDI